MAGTASISGVVSGFKTDEIIEKMMELAKAPVTRMESKKSTIQSKINVWNELNTRVLALKTKSNSLANISTFRNKDITSSNTDILTVSASSSAQKGTYFIKVNSLAKTHQVSSQGFADTTMATVGTGTIRVGAGSDGTSATNLLAGTVDSVTLATSTTLDTGTQTLVVDSVATAASREMTGTFAGADVAEARLQDAGAAGSITINGKSISFQDNATLGSVVDTINNNTATTGVTASITGSADNWHVTLTQQTRGTDKEIAYAEDAAILNGGTASNFTIAGTDATGHIGTLAFNSGTGNTLKSADGDTIVLNDAATIGTKVGAFDVAGGTTITIDSTNNTLNGLRDAINAADVGVTASIINDGSATSPYRLLLTSKTGGTEGQITLDVSNLAGGTGPVFSTLQAAQDATLTLGEGAGAITVTKGSNTINDLITGVTLNLKSADEGETVTVDIAQNTTSAKQAIKEFVDQYNNLVDYIAPQFKYNATTKVAGTLFADSRLQSMLSDLRSDLFSPISGLNQSITIMSQIGITSTVGDKIQVDEAKLDKALEDNFDQVANLFARVGTASNSNISSVSGTPKTKPSGSAGYAVNITQAPTQAYIMSGGGQTSALAQNETLTVNGVQIALFAGMTQTQVVEKLNEYSSKTGVTASIGTDNHLKLQRRSYGVTGHITVSSDVSANTNPGANTGIGTTSVTETSVGGELGTGTGAQGRDVQGTINGESATGAGEYLTGNTGNENTEGLSIRFTGTTTGSFGNVVYTRGVAGVLADYADSVTQATVGSIASAKSALQDQMDDIGETILNLQKRLEDYQQRLYNQFNAMESAMSRLQSQGNSLASLNS